MDNGSVRAALERHWAASDANDFEAEQKLSRGRRPYLSAIGRADSWTTQHSGEPDSRAKQQAFYRSANYRQRKTSGSPNSYSAMMANRLTQ